MAQEVKLPIFKKGTPEEKVERCIRWTWARIRKVDQTAEQVRATAFRETPAQLIAQRGVFYMNPCAPQTITCLEVLKANGFQPNVVIDLVQVRGHVAPHFAIQLKIDGSPHCIEFRTNGVNFDSGKYTSPWFPHDKSLARFHLSGKRFGLHKTLLDATPQRVREQAFGKGYTVQQHADRLAREVEPRKFTIFKERVLSKITPKKVIHRRVK